MVILQFEFRNLSSTWRFWLFARFLVWRPSMEILNWKQLIVWDIYNLENICGHDVMWCYYRLKHRVVWSVSRSFQCTMGVGYKIIFKMCSLQTIKSNLSEGTGSPAPINASSFCVTSFGESSQPTASSTECMLLPIVKQNLPIICTSSITSVKWSQLE